MNTDAVMDVAINSMSIAIMLAAPILIVSIVVGLAVSIFQATTHIQEQTLTFLPKLLVILVVIALLANSIFTDMREFTIELFKQIPNFAK